MQTIYYETSNFIRHEGNLVDLAAYRQKLAAVSGGNWSPAPEGSPAFEAEAHGNGAAACAGGEPRPAARPPHWETAPPCRPGPGLLRQCGHRGPDGERRDRVPAPVKHVKFPAAGPQEVAAP